MALDFWIHLSDVDPLKDLLLVNSRLLLPCHLDRDYDSRFVARAHFTNAGLPAAQAPYVMLSRISVLGKVNLALALDFGWCSKRQFEFGFSFAFPWASSVIKGSSAGRGRMIGTYPHPSRVRRWGIHKKTTKRGRSSMKFRGAEPDWALEVKPPKMHIFACEVALAVARGKEPDTDLHSTSLSALYPAICTSGISWGGINRPLAHLQACYAASLLRRRMQS